MKLDMDKSDAFFHFIMDKFLEMEGIDPSEISDEDGGWLLYIANFFYTQGLCFAVEEGGIEVTESSETKH